MKKWVWMCALGGLLVPPGATAWGTEGHRAVGAMADRLIMGTHAQQQVAALLLPGESLEQLANWLDCAKGRVCGAPTPEMLAYTGANPRHAGYHYTNIPYQNQQYRDGGVGSTRYDVVQTLRQAIAVLQCRGDAANPHHFTPRQALMLVAHLVADIHQPLHVGVPYVGQDGAFAAPQDQRQIDGIHIVDTRGGNDLLIDAARPGGGPWSFHAYWDIATVTDALRRSGARTPAQFAQIAIAGQPVVAGNTGDPAGWPYQWADDALQASKLAHAGLAPGQVGEQAGSKGERHAVWALALPQDYAVTSSALAKTQLVKSGYRLAALLQAIWP